MVYDEFARFIKVDSLNLKELKFINSEGKDELDTEFIFPDDQVKLGCKWSKQLSYDIAKILPYHAYPYKRNIPYLSKYHKLLSKFFLMLDCYHEESKNGLPSEYIFDGGIFKGPEFAEELERINRKALWNFINAELLEIPEWYDKVRLVEISNLSDLFPIRLLPNWLENIDNKEFYEIPVNQNPETLKQFRETCKGLLSVLPNKLFSDYKDKFFRKKGSKALLNGESLPSWQIPDRDTASSIGTVRRSIAPVCAGGYRDTITLEKNVSDAISKIENIVSRIVFQFRESYMKCEDDYERYMSSHCKHFQKFLQRDFEKEGITKPRNLLEIMLDEIEKRFNLGINPKFYNDLQIIDFDESTFVPKRGHGLGMANSLTTLMQIIIFHMTIERLTENHNKDMHENIKGFFFNDDALVGFLDSDLATEFNDEDDWILYNLSLIKKRTKSYFTTNTCVFIEKYINDKDVLIKKHLYKYIALLPLCGINRSHAQSLINVYSEKYRFLNYIKDFWRSQFIDDSEYFIDDVLSGWRQPMEHGVDIRLYHFDSIHSYDKIKWMSTHCVDFSLQFRKGKKDNKLIPNSYNSFKNILDEESKIAFDILTYKQAKQKFTQRRMNVRLEYYSWRIHDKKIRNMFKKPISDPEKWLWEHKLKMFPSARFITGFLEMEGLGTIDYRKLIQVKRDEESMWDRAFDPEKSSKLFNIGPESDNLYYELYTVKGNSEGYVNNQMHFYYWNYEGVGKFLYNSKYLNIPIPQDRKILSFEDIKKIIKEFDIPDNCLDLIDWDNEQRKKLLEKLERDNPKELYDEHKDSDEESSSDSEDEFFISGEDKKDIHKRTLRVKTTLEELREMEQLNTDEVQSDHESDTSEEIMSSNVMRSIVQDFDEKFENIKETHNYDQMKDLIYDSNYGRDFEILIGNLNNIYSDASVNQRDESDIDKKALAVLTFNTFLRDLEENLKNILKDNRFLDKCIKYVQEGTNEDEEGSDQGYSLFSEDSSSEEESSDEESDYG